jgi:hypothetical protein
LVATPSIVVGPFGESATTAFGGLTTQHHSAVA